MTLKRGVIYAVLGLVLLGVSWLFWHQQDTTRDHQIAAPVLAPDDKAKIIIDQKHHTLTRVERDSTTNRETVVRSYLNPHGPVSVTEKKDGKVVLAQRSYGTCADPFVGGALGSDFRFRATLGLDLLYLQRWELGGGLLVNVGDIRDTRLFGHLAYNVYSNMLLSVGFDNQKTVHLMADLKF